jgi:hypothetical protein
MADGNELLALDKVPLNNQLIDFWSLVHFGSGAALGWIMHPLVAIAILTLYEPFEVYLIYPFLYEHFGIVFGNETYINSFSDIVVNSLGVAFGYFVLRKRYPPPFVIFEKPNVSV